ncbi:hypothetical protein P0Y35_08525 [Kiritimatiellaeota bacterium B1221]|nr:hypothetical protein [Kiritimatiellaeota bacterium B1221]
MSESTAKIIDIGDESMLGLCDDGRKIWLTGPAVPGDIVQFDLEGKTGVVTEILEPAPERREAFCPHFADCPGCQLQPLPYPQQLELKGKKIVEALRRLGGFSEVPFAGVEGSTEEFGTRNKLDFTVDGNQVGYQTRKGLLPVSTCPVGDPSLDKFIPHFQEWLGKNPRHQLHRLMLRTDGERKSVHVLLRGILGDTEQASLQDWAGAQEKLSSLSIQEDWRAPWENLLGAGNLDFSLAGQSHRIAYDAFFQVHDRLADILVRESIDLLGEPKGALLDLFCGVGAFTLPAQQKGWQVMGVDSRPGKGPFTRSDLRKGIPKKLLNQKWHTVLTDPPRSGMEKNLCAQIRDQLRPQQIVYVSCNPATLARDLQRICAKGKYELISVKGFDLFPQTTHVETLALLRVT